MSTWLRPLWQVLIDATQSGASATLDCDECFASLEYLADVAMLGAEREVIVETARHHLQHCPGCRAQHRRRLRELEAMLEKPANRPEG